MNQIIEHSPAKVNLYLKILGKRRDGYHDIETLFEKIDILDEITISKTENGISCKCDNPSVPDGKENICYKAAELLKNSRNIADGIAIEIDKNIPVAAGLGGGSSNAASVLMGINKLCNLGLSTCDLRSYASELGSDVAFFLENCSFAVGKGRGELVKPISGKLVLWHLVVNPGIELSSGHVYSIYSKKYGLNLTIKGVIDRILPPETHIDNVGQLDTFLHNDLEDAVIDCQPIIQEVKNVLLSSGARKTLVSGSGSSVFGLYGTRKEAVRAEECCKKLFPENKEWRTFVAKTY